MEINPKSNPMRKTRSEGSGVVVVEMAAYYV
jgi:hypothetical protein